jgi:hypothetical protein
MKKMKPEHFQRQRDADRPQWRIRRVDIRSPLSQLRGHVARVELEHPNRGRVTDMGSGLDVLSAAFAAVAHILDCKASIISLHSYQRKCRADDERDQAMAAILVDCEGLKRRGTATGQDVFHASLAAFIEAIASAEERDCSPLLAGLNMTSDMELLAARPCQASGLDENGDWWLFASEDEGAAEAIAAEFRDEGYEQVRVSVPEMRSGLNLRQQ